MSSALPAPLKKVWLGNRPESAAQARHELLLTARALGLAADVVDRLELCTSEIVTNVIQHADCSLLTMCFTRTAERLRVEVNDSSASMPVSSDPDLCQETGRGLFIVAHQSDGHGAYRTRAGKTVWFEVIAWPGQKR
ncbi:ATP-binding protein [Actinomadura barringtoniae]|uniref:ATP-binding protein n=1 Tax=Actinomadura barringtoniae TaxID=1427535 RepID=A0A939PFU8_9ACTN|nr:ATP-binding protein [Actinomadura barringtoniae]MBO2451513.1 ATP-binding protein [Actinomadura barringtoniae]